MAIKVITIDFWNTLFDSKNGYERNQYRNRILKDHFEELGFSFSDEDYNNAMKDSWEYFSEIWQREMRTPMSGELVEYYFKKMNVTAEIERMDSIAYIFEESILQYMPDLIQGVKENLDILREKYKLAIISDTGFSPGKVLRVLLHRNGIFDHFSAFSFSDETGVSKPHEKAFRHILDQFGCLPEEALHIGDIEKTDIVGAKNIGMKAIRFGGDQTSYFYKDRTQSTIADAEATSWDEIPALIESIENL